MRETMGRVLRHVTAPASSGAGPDATLSALSLIAEVTRLLVSCDRADAIAREELLRSPNAAQIAETLAAFRDLTLALANAASTKPTEARRGATQAHQPKQPDLRLLNCQSEHAGSGNRTQQLDVGRELLDALQVVVTRLDEDLDRIRQRDEEDVLPLVDTAPLPVVAFHLDDLRISYINEVAAEFLHVSASGAIGQPVPHLFVSEEAAQQLLDELRREGRLGGHEIEVRQPDGGMLWAQVSGALVVRQGRQIAISVWDDITPRRKAEDELREIATTDALTGIWNRRAILALAEREIAHSGDTSAPFSLLMVDVDHFKRVNDTYGHLVGDVVLRAVADRIRAAVRSSDHVGRYGGEEFLVALPGADVAKAADVAERIRHEVFSAAIAAQDIQLHVTISVGVFAQDGGRARPLEDAIGAADGAMYRAKQSGRNRVEVAEQQRHDIAT